MRTLVILICSLALVTAYGAQKDEKKSQQKKQAQTNQRAAHPTGRPAGGAGGKKTSNAAYQGQNARKGPSSVAATNAQKGKKSQTSARTYEGRKGNQSQTSTAVYNAQKGKKNQTSAQSYERQKAKQAQTSTAAYQGREKAKKNQTQVERQTGKAAKGGKVTEANAAMAKPTTMVGTFIPKATGKPFKPQHFNVAKQPNIAKAPAVKFQQGRRIQGSQNWHGQQYNVFRNYQSQWHDQNWWHSHYRNNIVFVFGAPYYWNAGYWFPAWGYNPNAYYAWDGPIYAYNHLPPDQVIANVQAALQQQGYYHGDVDGLIGPLTRGAISDYQRDHGLYMTSTIDQPTLRSLGMA
jgi:Putative peptidoglycan binding domain